MCIYIICVTGEDTPNLLIDPSKSVVLQLKCAELIPTQNFSTGVTCRYGRVVTIGVASYAVTYFLRFPRTERIRYDKATSECLTMGEVLLSQLLLLFFVLLLLLLLF